MKRLSCWITSLLAAVVSSPLVSYGQQYPQAEISNGLVRVGLYLPDAETGYYRGTRFDWSGVIYSLTYQGHSYFSPWQEKHDPLVHNSISGPVDTFDELLGYQEAKPGGLFARIGVGLLQKPEDPSFRPAMTTTFKVVDSGGWAVKKGADWIEFTQTIPDKTGYAYVYTKRIRLERDKPEMVLSHTLRNTGTKLIETTGFNHNFFVIDHQPSGPGFLLRFPFEPRGKLSPDKVLELRGRELRFLKELQGQETAMAILEGYGATVKDYDIAIENQTTGACVRITGDRPLDSLRVFFRRPNVCPEPFFRLRVEPGQEEKWAIRYLFYSR
jgi:hypothetical protein